MSDRVNLRSSLPRSCNSLYAGEIRHSDPQGRTRASQAPSKISVYTQISRELSAVHQQAYIPKHTRPAFDKETELFIYQNADTKELASGDLKVTLYACKGFSNQIVYLPQKADLKLAKSLDSSIDDYATLGHIVQWREHIANMSNPERYIIEVDNKDYEVYAYSKDDVRRYYNDTDNLRLESQRYNSSVAYSYDSSDDPLMPTYRAI